MARIRATYMLTGLLAVVLLCGWPTGGMPVAPANAGPNSTYLAQAETTPLDTVPGGFSHEGVPPEIVSPLVIVGKGERSTTAALTASATTSSLRLATVANIAAQAAPLARSTPLYLSHCAFLC